jgi:hypothetical protein
LLLFHDAVAPPKPTAAREPAAVVVGTRASNLQEYTQLMVEFSGYSCLPDDDDLLLMQLPTMMMWVTGQLKTLHRRYSGENWREQSFPFEVTAISLDVPLYR